MAVPRRMPRGACASPWPVTRMRAAGSSLRLRSRARSQGGKAMRGPVGWPTVALPMPESSSRLTPSSRTTWRTRASRLWPMRTRVWTGTAGEVAGREGDEGAGGLADGGLADAGEQQQADALLAHDLAHEGVEVVADAHEGVDGDGGRGRRAGRR